MGQSAHQSLVDDTRNAAMMTGVDPEQFSLGQVHFHALRVADPKDPDRMFHMTSLLAAASTTADLIAPPLDDDEGPEMEIPTDLPPAPIDEEPQTPEERKRWGAQYLDKLLATVRK